MTDKKFEWPSSMRDTWKEVRGKDAGDDDDLEVIESGETVLVDRRFGNCDKVTFRNLKRRGFSIVLGTKFVVGVYLTEDCRVYTKVPEVGAELMASHRLIHSRREFVQIDEFVVDGSKLSAPPLDSERIYDRTFFCLISKTDPVIAFENCPGCRIMIFGPRRADVRTFCEKAGDGCEITFANKE